MFDFEKSLKVKFCPNQKLFSTIKRQLDELREKI